MLAAGCAGMRPDAGALMLTGNDDAAAAAVLRDRLHAAGLPVEPAESPASLFVYRRGRATLLSPVLQAEGLDRIIAARSYAPAAGRGAAELETLALSLNRALNVAGFKVSGDALLMEANLTFVDRLEVAELLAFLDWLDSIELAIRRVDAESRALLLTTT
jgi:hypothetical protein